MKKEQPTVLSASSFVVGVGGRGLLLSQYLRRMTRCPFQAHRVQSSKPVRLV